MELYKKVTVTKFFGDKASSKQSFLVKKLVDTKQARELSGREVIHIDSAADKLLCQTLSRPVVDWMNENSKSINRSKLTSISLNFIPWNSNFFVKVGISEPTQDEISKFQSMEIMKGHGFQEFKGGVAYFDDANFEKTLPDIWYTLSDRHRISSVDLLQAAFTFKD